MRPVLRKIKEVFPESAHTNMYGSFSDIHRKTVNELREMKELGVEMIVTGLESGSDIVLSEIKKGYTAEEVILAGQKLNEAGIGFGATVILGLGGVKNSEDHVRESIRVMNEINAPAIGTTVVNPQAGKELFYEIQSGAFELPTYRQIFWEEAEILKGLQIKRTTFVFSGGMLPDNRQIIVGNLPDDKGRIFKQLDSRENQNPQWLDYRVRMNTLL